MLQHDRRQNYSHLWYPGLFMDVGQSHDFVGGHCLFLNYHNHSLIVVLEIKLG